MKFLGLAATLCALLAGGCTAVAPYQRGYLARPDMAFDADRER
jgi:hypothetical protein